MKISKFARWVKVSNILMQPSTITLLWQAYIILFNVKRVSNPKYVFFLCYLTLENCTFIDTQILGYLKKKFWSFEFKLMRIVIVVILLFYKHWK